MSIKPILFNTDMVKEILDGRKTVTRRVLKPHFRDNEYGYRVVKQKRDGSFCYVEYLDEDEVGTGRYIEPSYYRNDILYVRETWNRGYIEASDAELCNEHWFEEYHKHDGGFCDSISNYFYRADFTRAEEYELGTLDENDRLKPMPWRPSIHMPKEAARIFLRVKDVRAERLQDIRFAEIWMEGLLFSGEGTDREVREKFKSLWDSTIKKSDLPEYSWDANPWVWRIEFERCEKPEDLRKGI